MSEDTEQEKKHGRAWQTSEAIVQYVLPDLLPAGHVFAVHRRLGLLSWLAPGGEGASAPRLLAQEQFAESELRVLLPLLEQYPAYCPYEVMQASFITGRTTEMEVERFRQRLQEAQFAGVWDYEMRPVRNVLSRVRFKLRAFGLDVRSILETGYLLKPLPPVGTRASDSHREGIS